MNLLLEKASSNEQDFVLEITPQGNGYSDAIYHTFAAVEATEAIDRLSDSTSEALPQDNPLSRIEQAIKTSRNLLDLPDYEDEGGATPCSETAWRRATSFLRAHAELALQQHGFVVPVPSLLPGPERGIDLHWRTPTYELLVNIAADYEAPASFYADDYSSVTIKGTFDPELPSHELIAWLTDRVLGALRESVAMDGEAHEVSL